jgi:uncharacterized membrane protein HdeD (DUF308 family)
MNAVLWILQVLLGIFFVFHAFLMLRPNPARLQAGMKYVLELPSWLRMFAGAAEGLAGIALVVAPFLGPLKVLAPLAAAGLVVLMIGAIVFHLGRREYPNIGLNAVLAIIAAVIVWGRFGPYQL